jgi:hypothetical protein
MSRIPSRDWRGREGGSECADIRRVYVTLFSEPSLGGGGGGGERSWSSRVDYWFGCSVRSVFMGGFMLGGMGGVGGGSAGRRDPMGIGSVDTGLIGLLRLGGGRWGGGGGVVWLGERSLFA